MVHQLQFNYYGQTSYSITELRTLKAESQSCDYHKVFVFQLQMETFWELNLHVNIYLFNTHNTLSLFYFWFTAINS